MVEYEFEYYSENGREIAIVELASNTEASNTGYRWLREKRAEIYRRVHPRMTRPERKEILSSLALLHVSVSKPVARDEFGDVAYREKRR